MNVGVYGNRRSVQPSSAKVPLAVGKYVSLTDGTGDSTISFSAGFGSVFPVYLDRPIRIDSVVVEVTTSNATARASFAIYNNTNLDAPNEYPGEMLWSISGVDTSSAGKKTMGCDVWLPSGTTWWGFATAVAASGFRAQLNHGYRYGFSASGIPTGANPALGYLIASATMPNPFTRGLSPAANSQSPVRFYARVVEWGEPGGI